MTSQKSPSLFGKHSLRSRKTLKRFETFKRMQSLNPEEVLWYKRKKTIKANLKRYDKKSSGQLLKTRELEELVEDDLDILNLGINNYRVLLKARKKLMKDRR